MISDALAALIDAFDACIAPVTNDDLDAILQSDANEFKVRIHAKSIPANGAGAHAAPDPVHTADP